MEYYPITQYQKKIAQKPLYRNRAFISLLAISLSLNFYFFIEKGEQPFNDDQPGIKKIDDTMAAKAPVKIKKAAYIKSEKPGDQEIRVLHFVIENSINHTLCKHLPKVECGLMTAYIGRILVWYFDLNKY